MLSDTKPSRHAGSSSATATPASSLSSSTFLPSFKLYQVVIFATPVLFGIILLLLLVLFYLRRRRLRMMNTRVRALLMAGSPFPSRVEKGLSKSFRQASLPVLPYEEGLAANTGCVQCAVCLDEYKLGEKIQQLPLCGHIFHVECIDEWLAANSTCPICRASCLQLVEDVTEGCGIVEASDISNTSASMHSRRWQERVLMSQVQLQQMHLSSSSRSWSGAAIGGGGSSMRGSSTSSFIADIASSHNQLHQSAINVERS